MRTTRKYGANYLIDNKVARTIANTVSYKDKDVLEVGAGSGQLTKFINGYRSLTLIESNRNLERTLKTMFPGAEVKIGNALEIDWPLFQIFVSNMPYSISSPLLEKLWNCSFETAVVTLQKEVAERALATPSNKEYSRLSIMMQLKFRISRQFDIPPSSFSPPPKVYSTVLKLQKKDAEIPRGFDSFLKQLFSQRRKKIGNIIQTGLYGDRRPEELSVDEFMKLFGEFSGQRLS